MDEMTKTTGLWAVAGAALLLLVLLPACRVTYGFRQGAIDPAIKTVSIPFFPNSATLVAPTLSSTLTDALQDRFARQTKLQLVRGELGDMAFEGEVIGYTTAPSAISADEYSIRNKLTITVKVKFSNRLQPQYNFDRTFTAFTEYPTTQLLTDVEPTLIPELCEMLVEDIFNAATSTW
ncbi:MAG: LPS assembly lipoprotein LptE [Rikenellaceae bacterium]|jgi:hypothetical protein|nr:LPS assembly lipoprotein LptE [Rikenellaceae bacterium]